MKKNPVAKSLKSAHLHQRIIPNKKDNPCENCKMSCKYCEDADY
jgi:hypothetical protein